METGQLCAAWASAIAGLNEDDFTVFEELLAPACVFDHVGSSRNEIIEAFKRDRASGWRRHEILGITTADQLLATTARNVQADGTVVHVAGVVRFNQDGQIVYMSAIDQHAPLPTSS
jgi:hypothetical protein